MANEEFEKRNKTRKSLKIAVETFQDRLQGMEQTINIWRDEVKLMRRILNDNLKKL